MKHSITALCWLLPYLIYAQGATFKAICNASEVVAGEPFEVSFRMENAKITAFTKPDFRDFDAMGPSTSSAVSYVNGKTFQNETYTFVLYAKREGKFIIGAATAQSSTGQRLASQPISIKVVKGSKSNTAQASSNTDFFLRTEVSNTKPVVGEQVAVDLKLYWRAAIQNYSLVQLPQINNVFSHDVRLLGDTKKTEVVNGKQYATQVLHRTVIFPTKAGQLTINGGIIQIGVLDESADVFSPFAQIAPHTLKSDAVELQVAAFPTPPADFSGTVGDFEVQAYTEKTTITSDDVVHLFVRVHGKGDLKQVFAPKIEFPNGAFENYPPNANEEIRENGAMLGGTKTFEYVLTPRAVGEFEVRPTFVFYSTQSRQFVRKDTTFRIVVTQGKNALPTLSNGSLPTPTDSTSQAAPKDSTLQPLAPQTETLLAPRSESLWYKWWFWGVCMLPFGAMVGIRYREQHQATQNAIPEKVIRRQNANNTASKRLAQAQQLLQQGDNKGFHNEISSVLRTYVADKLHIALAEVNKQRIQTELEARQVPTATIQSLIVMLQTCELALFAGINTSESMQSLHTQANSLLSDLEKHLS